MSAYSADAWEDARPDGSTASRAATARTSTSYLTWLTSTGYDLGPVECLAIGTMTAAQVDRAHARADATT